MNDWVIRLIEQSGYLGVGFLMFLETVFPPIPSEVIMPIAGMAAAEGKSKDAKYADGVAVFTHAKKGLMAEASVGGQKFKFTPKK